MRRIIELLRGFPGHPSHPPLTDATIGALTAGFVLVLLAWFGIAEETLVRASFAVVVVGLVFAVPTALTGLLDYFRIRRGTPFRRTATIHLLSMVTSVVLFIAAAWLLQDGYESGQVSAGAGVVTVVAWLILLFGGWVGGSIVFVYGMRVLMRPETPTAEALKPKLPPGPAGPGRA
jgi:uncharacterized membrane protein